MDDNQAFGFVCENPGLFGDFADQTLGTVRDEFDTIIMD